ncbi:uncharacterized protein LOC143799810 [Ranitomeya variabilis]|uniref:uncharacterized protein LOC143799810 n=1 Tax=Ranitomeya variabilis TaxID=490064 RepID=UPI004057BE1D
MFDSLTMQSLTLTSEVVDIKQQQQHVITAAAQVLLNLKLHSEPRVSLASKFEFTVTSAFVDSDSSLDLIDSEFSGIICGSLMKVVIYAQVIFFSQFQQCSVLLWIQVTTFVTCQITMLSHG